MNLDFDEAQLMLRTQARDFITEKCPPTVVKEIVLSQTGFSQPIWQSIAGLGWMGIPFPEKYGGAGMTIFEMLLILEEMGHGAVPSPFLSTMLCSLAINEFGTEEQKKELLPKIIDGSMIFAPAWTEPNGSLEPSGINLKASKGPAPKYSLAGTKLFCPDAHIAHKLLVVARTAPATKEDPTFGITLFIAPAKDPSVVCRPQSTVGFDNQSQIEFANLILEEANILGKLNQGWQIIGKILDWGALGMSAEMVGAANRSLEMSVSYAKERVQYDKHIGSFQTQQHRLADMWIGLESCRNYFYEASWRFVNGENDPMLVPKTKIMVTESAEYVTENAIRLHGAIGITWDYDLGLFHRRVRAASQMFGNPAFHKRKLTELLEKRMKEAGSLWQAA